MVEVLDDVFEVLMCHEEAEDVFEDVYELVLCLRVAETAVRKYSLNAILRTDLPHLSSRSFLCCEVSLFPQKKCW
jgi:hypothetical protein